MVATAKRISITPAYSRSYLSNDLADLSHIYESRLNLCVVKRGVEAELKHFVQQLLAASTVAKSINVIENIDFASFDFFEMLPKVAHLPGYQVFCKDVARLTALYCDLFALQRVGLRLRVLDHAMCPRFHVDAVTCRLVSTYGGLGTEWLEEAYIDRRKLGSGSGGLNDEVSGLIMDAYAIQAMPAYAIGLLKGSAWESNEAHGAVHRSPRMTIHSPNRLLLTLDFG